MLRRLEAQAEEAKLLGFTKTAENLAHQISDYTENVRKTGDDYTYTRQEMENDVQKLLWGAMVRISDYLGAGFDAKDSQESIDKFAEDLIHDVCVRAGVSSGVGAYEPPVPGESK